MSNLATIEEAFEFVRNGASIKQLDGASGIPITRIETIWNTTIDEERFGYANIEDIDEYKNHQLEDGDILMSHINSPKHLGKCAIYRSKPKTLIHGMNLLNLRPRRNILVPQFAFYYLSSIGFKEAITKISNQSVNQASFSTTNLKKVKIPLPPLAEQQKVAAILDAADSLRQKDQQLVERYTALSQSLFLEMFGDPVTNPMGWEYSLLGDVGNWKSGGTPDRKMQEYYDGDIPWVTSGELNDCYLTDTKEHISEAAIQASSTKIIEEGSLLLGMYDTAALKSSITTGKMSCNQAIAYAKLDSTKVNVLFIYHLIQYAKEHYKRLQRGVRQKNLNLSMIKEIEIIHPPISLQNQFANSNQLIEAQKQQAQQSLAKSEALFNSLLQRAFTGELTAKMAA